MSLKRRLDAHLVDTGIKIRRHKCTIGQVVDLSKTLTRDEINILKKGSGYIHKENVATKKILEQNCSEWNTDVTFQSYPTRQTREAKIATNLAKNKNLVIKKADKGNCFVIMSQN